jgi:TrmH RNA methyltransferase
LPGSFFERPSLCNRVVRRQPDAAGNRAMKHKAEKPTLERSGEPRDAVEVIYGLRAGLAVFARRRDDIVRCAHVRIQSSDHAASRALRRELDDLTRWAAARHVPCVEMREPALDAFAGSTHHEGLCIIARPRRWLSTSQLGDAFTRAGGAGLALDRVRNPYNIGAMLRTAAFYGLEAALLGTPAPHPGLPPSAVRVAEGGAEHLKMARTTDLAETLARLRACGVQVVGADVHATTSEGSFAFERAALLVMGNEREGLGDRVRAQCDAFVAIRGNGAIESLNVAVAAGILLAAMVGAQKSRASETAARSPRGTQQ